MADLARCIRCGHEGGGIFCDGCGTIMPVPSDVNYFRLLGFDPRPLVLDERLKDTYLKLSQQLHPDKFQGRSKEELDLAVQWSSLINKAYGTLKDPTERIPYLVSLETGKDPKLARTTEVSKWTLTVSQNVGGACQEADKLIAQKRTASKIVAASIAKEVEERMMNLESLKNLAAEMRKRTISDLEKIDAQWQKSSPDRRGALIRLLSKLGGDLAYLAKMDALLEERLLQLRI